MVMIRIAGGCIKNGFEAVDRAASKIKVACSDQLALACIISLFVVTKI